MSGLASAEAIALVLGSGMLDAMHYMQVAGLGPEPDEVLARHYLEHGEAAGLSLHPLFDPLGYRAAYLAAAEDVSPVIDYIRQGHGTKNPHAVFDQAFYLGQSEAAVPAEVPPLVHYCQDGWRLGLDPHPLFSVMSYLDRNEDIRRLGHEPLQHYLSDGWREGRAPCEGFDSAFYVATYADVRNSGINPLLHFVNYGAAEGRSPSAEFDVVWYRSWMEHDAEAAAYPNPLAHYLRVGRARGYTASAVDVVLSEAGVARRGEFGHWASTVRAAYRLGMPKDRRTELLIVRSEGAGEGEGLPFEAPASWLGPASAEGAVRLVFLQAGDRLEAAAAEILAHAGPSGGAAGAMPVLFTMDSFSDEGAGVRPHLLPGLNRVHLLHAEVVPPFAAESAFCRDHAPQENEAFGAWFRRLVEAATAGGPGGLCHIPVPGVEVPAERHGAESCREAVGEVVDLVADVGGAARCGPMVSVIICTKDCGHLLMQLVLGLVRPETDGVKEVILVLNQPKNAFAVAYHARLARLPLVRIVMYDREYNFSDQCNEGARVAGGGFLLFLNDDVVPVGDRWLSRMLSHFADRRVGLVGPLLLYPDERVQHAGMYLGFNNVCGHTLRGAKLPRRHSSAGLVPSNCSAVTGAAMLVRAEVFEALNGFDYSLATYLQDLDLCLRMLRMGLEIIYDPGAILFHMESISAAVTFRDPAILSRRGREFERFHRRWATMLQLDRHHNLNWLIQDESLSTLAAAQPARFKRLIDG